MPRILIVDDEPEMVRGLEDNLRFEGYQTLSATDGRRGLALALSEAPDLVLLDIMMPGMSGWDVCRELRAKGLDIPVIMLTARGEEADRVQGLELGADDYVTKPFGLRELMARIRAVLRRPGPRQKFEEFAFGDVRIRLRGRQVFRAGKEVRLTRKEFDLLRYLVEHRRGHHARQAARRGLGVRAVPDDADRGHPYSPAQAEVRGRPRAPGVHPDRPRPGLPLRGLGVGC